MIATELRKWLKEDPPRALNAKMTLLLAGTALASLLAINTVANSDVSFKGYIVAALTAILAIILIVIIVLLAAPRTHTLHPVPDPVDDDIGGKPLAAFPFYPVRADKDGKLFLDKSKLHEAVRYVRDTHDPKAALDLLYLIDSNLDTIMPNKALSNRIERIRKKYKFHNTFAAHKNARDKIFTTYKKIVEGVGETLHGTPIEIVLHDTRDPLHSVVVVKNPITGRRPESPNTNFGLELIKKYEKRGSESSANHVGYALNLPDGRTVKSTTIPLEHHKYGLIGFICINMDVSELKKNDAAINAAFIEKLIHTPLGTSFAEAILNN